jgi:hypothetical protein
MLTTKWMTLSHGGWWWCPLCSDQSHNKKLCIQINSKHRTISGLTGTGCTVGCKKFRVQGLFTCLLKADSHIACHAHAIPHPCRAAKDLECLSHLIYTVRPCLIHTCLAVATPCSDHAVLLKATTQDGHWETTCGRPARVRLLPATTWSSTKAVIRSIPISDAGDQCETKQCLSWTRKRVVAAHYKKDTLLNCWTSSLDISGYHVDFHEGHGTVRSGQGRGVARVNWRTGWQGNGMGAACYVWISLQTLVVVGSPRLPDPDKALQCIKTSGAIFQ